MIPSYCFEWSTKFQVSVLLPIIVSLVILIWSMASPMVPPNSSKPISPRNESVTESNRMPAIYIPHGGGPAFFMKEGGMREMFQGNQDFLATVDNLLPSKPKSILLISAHWEANPVTVNGNLHSKLIYDYYGFPPEMYKLKYPATGNPELADQVTKLLNAVNIKCEVDPEAGYDHGVFIPLKVMYPDANIPVVSISVHKDLKADFHVAMGRALAPLRDQGVLIVGSGMSFHNLRGFGSEIYKDISLKFDAWLDKVLSGSNKSRGEQLSNWLSAPSARDAHPREEHLIPLMVVSGAGSDTPAKKIWAGTIGQTRISSWAFY